VNAQPQDRLFVGLPAERDVVARFEVPGEPVSKARARFTKYGSAVRSYTPEKTRTAEERMAVAYRGAGGRLEQDADVTFGVTATFYNGTRQRRDVDNMLKLVLDGLNRVAWLDDNQVVEVTGRKRYVGKASPALTEVVVYRVGRIDRDRLTCQQCGVEFLTYASWSARKFCSAECISASRRKARERTCEHCGRAYHAHGKTRATRFCSVDCSNAAGRIDIPCGTCGTTFSQNRSWAAQGRVYCSTECSHAHDAEVRSSRRTATFRGTCLVCGAGTTRPEYKRCAPCRIAGRPVPEVAS
jgi:crossover junction endodeoxyribonuclease RusA